MPVESLFAVPAALPTVPRVVHELMRSFECEDVTVDQVADQLRADPVLSAKLLRLANSAYFHVSRQIASVDDALRMLGFVMVRNLVMGLGLAGAFKQVRGLDLPQFWRYSAHTAFTARWLAERAGQHRDLAFSVGLMHALGQLVMHAVLKDELVPLNRRCHPLAAERPAAEREMLGYDHAEVGAELARRWKLPAALADAIGPVPAPTARDPLVPMAALVHVAAWRARAEVLGWPEDTLSKTFPRDAAEAAGLDLVPPDDDPAALVLRAHGERHPMPRPAELSQGMEAMFG